MQRTQQEIIAAYEAELKLRLSTDRFPVDMLPADFWKHLRSALAHVSIKEANCDIAVLGDVYRLMDIEREKDLFTMGSAFNILEISTPIQLGIYNMEYIQFQEKVAECAFHWNELAKPHKAAAKMKADAMSKIR